MLQLLRQRITKGRFKFNMTEEQARDLLLAAYKAEVVRRHRTFEETEETKGVISKLAGILTRQTEKFGILFCGTCGNGKTTTVYALSSAIEMLSRAKMLDDGYKGLRIVNSGDVLRLAQDEDRFRLLKNEELLAIDDMGREATEIMDYGNRVAPMTDLLEYRYDRQLFTLVTTNLIPKEIREKYGARIADRFNEMMNVLIFEHPTYRK